MSTVLDTPAQISMWVLLSRRAQIKMHLAGYPIRGLATCLKREFPEVGGRYVKDFIVPVEFAISEAGGNIDYDRVNVHVMKRLENGYFLDMGIFPDMDSAGTRTNRTLFHAGLAEIVLTLDKPRGPITNKLYTA